MSDVLSFALLSEGTSDRALVPLLRWLVAQHVSPSLEPEGRWVDRHRLPKRAIGVPADRLRSAVTVYACDLLFVHRDEDRAGSDHRQAEIDTWVAAAKPLGAPVVAVIPVTCTEAWLLIDEMAIRRAVGNPNGREPLRLPRSNKVEQVADPKAELFAAMRVATGLSGRRLKSFDFRSARHRISDHIASPADLRRLPAFRRLEAGVVAECKRQGWVP